MGLLLLPETAGPGIRWLGHPVWDQWASRLGVERARGFWRSKWAQGWGGTWQGAPNILWEYMAKLRREEQRGLLIGPPPTSGGECTCWVPCTVRETWLPLLPGTVLCTTSRCVGRAWSQEGEGPQFTNDKQ